jgi:hypothetical protein
MAMHTVAIVSARTPKRVAGRRRIALRIAAIIVLTAGTREEAGSIAASIARYTRADNSGHAEPGLKAQWRQLNGLLILSE